MSIIDTISMGNFIEATQYAIKYFICTDDYFIVSTSNNILYIPVNWITLQYYIFHNNNTIYSIFLTYQQTKYKHV